MAETTPRSKVQIIDRPLVKPGKCANCGSATKPVIDIGLTVEWFGRLYICTDCAKEIAYAIGFVPQAELLEVQLASSQSFEEEIITRELVAVPNESIRSLLNVVDDIRNITGFRGDIVPLAESEPLGETSGTGTQGESPSDSDSDSDSSGDSTITGSEGTPRVPSITGLELD